MKIAVDSHLCSGHARCASVAPEVYDLDSNGYSTADGKGVPESVRDQALRGARACPERAIKLIED